MREANAARILTVVLATAGLSACSGNVETTGHGGSTGTGGSNAGGDAGVYDAPGDGLVADAVPSPLECSVVKDGQMIGPTASVNGTTLTVDLSFKDYIEGAIGWNGAPVVTASPELGTVDSVVPSGTTLTVTVTLAAGATTGTITLSGDLNGWGPPPNYGQIACPVARVFTVTLDGDGGPPMIARRDPAPALPLDQRPRLTLTLLGARGLDAEVRAVGVPEGASVEIEATGGVARHDGSLVRWALPPEPGLYQLELVVRHGNAVATSALALEVKDAAG